MLTPELVISTEPTPGEVQYLEDRLYEFNSAATGITGGEWLAIFVRDEHARVVAGICGNTWGGCLEIRQFWVEEARRKQGLGTRLLGAAEHEARRRPRQDEGEHDRHELEDLCLDRIDRGLRRHVLDDELARPHQNWQNEIRVKLRKIVDP